MSASSIGTRKRGTGLLHDPWINKRTGFIEAERQALVALVSDVPIAIIMILNLPYSHLTIS